MVPAQRHEQTEGRQLLQELVRSRLFLYGGEQCLLLGLAKRSN